MQTILNNEAQARLRTEKVISESEVAIQIGDKYIAENILTKTRREIAVPISLLENTHNKRVLRG